MITISAIIILFLAAFLVPSRAKRMQKFLHSHLKRVEKKAEKPPIVGPVLRWPFKSVRKVSGKSLRAGKKTRDKAPF